MNYYERHIGDYAKRTSHLSLIELGVLCALTDFYLGNEQAIPDERRYRLARAYTKQERDAVGVVLEEFFELVGGVWINAGYDEQIQRTRRRIEVAKENGTKGGRPRSGATQTKREPIGGTPGSGTEPNSKAPQAPSPSHQSPLVKAYSRKVSNGNERTSLSARVRERATSLEFSKPGAAPLGSLD